MVQIPDLLNGDGSAFAFHPPTGTVASMANVTMMYASNRRDPARLDTVLIDLKSGASVLRHVHAVEIDHYIVDNYVPDLSGDVPCVVCTRESIKFDEIVSVAVVVLASMI